MENNTNQPAAGVSAETAAAVENLAAESKEIVAKAVDETAIVFTEEEKAMMDELRNGSGEAEQGGMWTFLPYITINNEMVEAETKDGRKVMVRCEPEFNITVKEDDEYKTIPFMVSFEAVILKYMHRVDRKLQMDQQKNITNKMPFFRSLEFKSFQSDVHIRVKNQEGKMEFKEPMGYADVKKWAGEELQLWDVVYFLIPGEETVRKAEFKGASRGVMYDYITKKREYPVASVITAFSAELDNTQANPYNKLVLTNTLKKPENMAKILEIQKELNAMIDSNLEPSASPDPETKSIEAPKEKNVDEISIEGEAF